MNRLLFMFRLFPPHMCSGAAAETSPARTRCFQRRVREGSAVQRSRRSRVKRGQRWFDGSHKPSMRSKMSYIVVVGAAAYGLAIILGRGKKKKKKGCSFKEVFSEDPLQAGLPEWIISRDERGPPGGLLPPPPSPLSQRSVPPYTHTRSSPLSHATALSFFLFFLFSVSLSSPLLM